MTELPERDLPPGRHLLLKEHLMTEIWRAQDRPRTRRAWLRPALVAGAVAAVCAVTFTLVTPSGSGGGPGAQRSADAGAFLERAARAAEHEDGGLGDGRDEQYAYVDKRVSYTGIKGAASRTSVHRDGSMHRLEEWQPLDGTNRWLVRNDGQQEWITGPDRIPDGAHPDIVRIGNPSTLPTDADGMYALLKKWPSPFQFRNGQSLSAVGTMLWVASGWIESGLLPAKQSAALYRAVARIPGVTVVQHAVDGVGRSGVAIVWREPGFPGREEWIFDRKTYGFLGTRVVYTEEFRNRENDQLGDSVAIVRRAVVDKAGQRP
ncbi:CU044_5270 family protein [Streptomyces adustus]